MVVIEFPELICKKILTVLPGGKVAKKLKRDDFPVQECIDLGIWIQKGKQMCSLILYDILLKSVPMYMVISRKLYMYCCAGISTMNWMFFYVINFSH